MNIQELNKSKIPVVKIDRKLDKFKGKILFPEKLAKANAMLKKSGLPKSRYFRKPSVQWFAR